MKTVKQINEKEIEVDGILYEKKVIPQPKFKVGDWIFWSYMGVHYILRVLRIGEDLVYYYNDKEKAENNCFISNCRLATKEEIESYLKEEAKRRGYKEGQRLWSFYDNLVPYLRDGGFKLEGEFHYNNEEDSLQADDGLRLYCKGKWAEIIPEKKKLPKTKNELWDIVELYHDQNDGLPFKTPKEDFIKDYED